MTIVWMAGAWGAEIVAVDSDSRDAAAAMVAASRDEFGENVGIADAIDGVPADVYGEWCAEIGFVGEPDGVVSLSDLAGMLGLD